MYEHVAQPTRADQRFVSVVFPHQQQEISIGSITGDFVSGPCSGPSNFNHSNASVTTQGESGLNNYIPKQRCQYRS